MDLTRSKPELILENMLLRPQLIVLIRQAKRHALTGRDRVLLVLLASKLRTWKQAVVMVQPETVLRWHRPTRALGRESHCLWVGIVAQDPMAGKLSIRQESGTIVRA